MAIADVKDYAHLSEEEVERLGRELDQIRAPSADWSDRRAVFAPNSVIEERAVTP